MEELLAQTQIPFSIICIDIERFKVINDMFGIEKGDLLLKHLAKHFSAYCDQYNGIISRFASDIYMMCLPTVRNEESIKMILDIFRQLKNQMEIVPAIGIYEIKEDISVSFMCDNALLALASIKGNF